MMVVLCGGVSAVLVVVWCSAVVWCECSLVWWWCVCVFRFQRPALFLVSELR